MKKKYDLVAGTFSVRRESYVHGATGMVLLEQLTLSKTSHLRVTAEKRSG